MSGLLKSTQKTAKSFGALMSKLSELLPRLSKNIDEFKTNYQYLSQNISSGMFDGSETISSTILVTSSANKVLEKFDVTLQEMMNSFLHNPSKKSLGDLRFAVEQCENTLPVLSENLGNNEQDLNLINLSFQQLSESADHILSTVNEMMEIIPDSDLSSDIEEFSREFDNLTPAVIIGYVLAIGVVLGVGFTLGSFVTSKAFNYLNGYKNQNLENNDNEDLRQNLFSHSFLTSAFSSSSSSSSSSSPPPENSIGGNRTLGHGDGEPNDDEYVRLEEGVGSSLNNDI